VNETPYCLASHTILARDLGWSDDQLAHLADWPQREDFTPPKKPRCDWRRPSPAMLTL
jgi:alkylhydroperoxidase family enzyme